MSNRNLQLNVSKVEALIPPNPVLPHTQLFNPQIDGHPDSSLCLITYIQLFTKLVSVLPKSYISSSSISYRLYWFYRVSSHRHLLTTIIAFNKFPCSTTFMMLQPILYIKVKLSSFGFLLWRFSNIHKWTESSTSYTCHPALAVINSWQSVSLKTPLISLTPLGFWHKSQTSYHFTPKYFNIYL